MLFGHFPMFLMYWKHQSVIDFVCLLFLITYKDKEPQIHSPKYINLVCEKQNALSCQMVGL